MTKLVRLLILMSVLVLLLAMNVGVAFASNTGPGTENGPSAPVGSNISTQGFVNGFVNPNSNAFTAIANNPLCPLH